MKKIRLIVALAAVATSTLFLAACGKTTDQIVNTPVSTVKIQQSIDLLESMHKAALRSQLIYVNQPACVLPGSLPPPLCSSSAVGDQMKRLDNKATKMLVDAQKALDTVGNNPAAIDAAVAAAKLAVTELQDYTNSHVKTQ